MTKKIPEADEKNISRKEEKECEKALQERSKAWNIWCSNHKNFEKFKE